MDPWESTTGTVLIITISTSYYIIKLLLTYLLVWVQTRNIFLWDPVSEHTGTFYLSRSSKLAHQAAAVTAVLNRVRYSL